LNYEHECWYDYELELITFNKAEQI